MIIIFNRIQMLPSWRQLLPRQPSRWLLRQISMTLDCYIFRNADRWKRSNATTLIVPGPLYYISAINCIPPLTFIAEILSMVNAASWTVEISHSVTDLSSLVELSSCSCLIARWLNIASTWNRYISTQFVFFASLRVKIADLTETLLSCWIPSLRRVRWAINFMKYTKSNKIW